MKVTNKAITAYVRHQLSVNPTWALKALVRIFQENQTQDEQTSDTTKHDNNIGFSGVDAQILSSFAKQAISGRTLSGKQMTIVFRKMPRYSRQVIEFSDKSKLLKLVEQTSQ